MLQWSIHCVVGMLTNNGEETKTVSTIRIDFDDTDDKIIEQLATAIGAVKGMEVTEMEPLESSIDVEHLLELFDTVGGEPQVWFGVDNHQIVVNNSGRVVIEEILVEWDATTRATVAVAVSWNNRRERRVEAELNLGQSASLHSLLQLRGPISPHRRLAIDNSHTHR